MRRVVTHGSERRRASPSLCPPFIVRIDAHAWRQERLRSIVLVSPNVGARLSVRPVVAQVSQRTFHPAAISAVSARRLDRRV